MGRRNRSEYNTYRANQANPGHASMSCTIFRGRWLIERIRPSSLLPQLRIFYVHTDHAATPPATPQPQVVFPGTVVSHWTQYPCLRDWVYTTRGCIFGEGDNKNQ